MTTLAAAHDREARAFARRVSDAVVRPDQPPSFDGAPEPALSGCRSTIGEEMCDDLQRDSLQNVSRRGPWRVSL
jgi:hypothetical protein